MSVSSSSLGFIGLSGRGAVDTVFALSCEAAGISLWTTGEVGGAAVGVLCRDCGETEG